MTTFDRNKEPAPSAIRDYSFPAVEMRALPNGVRSVVCKAGDLPLITAHVVVDAGVSTEPPGKEGIAHLTANSLEGGTQTRTGTQLAWDLEELGLELSAWTSWEATHVRVTATADRIDDALTLLADIIRNPSFAAHEVERSRGEQIAEIMQRETEPRALADDMAIRFIFDERSAYGRSIYGPVPSVTTLTDTDVRAFHNVRFTPATTSVILTGDVEPERAHDLVTKAFGDWTGYAAAGTPPATRARVSKTRVFVVDRPGSVQSELRFGHVGVARAHPDHIALLIGNAILGGAFTSRLNLNLREKHGFTYGVRSGFSFRRGPGPFVIQSAVGTEVTARAIEESFKEIRALLKDGPTNDEVANARDYLAGIFPLQLQTSEELAAKIAEIVVYGLPLDYFQHYREHILDVRPDAVAAALVEHVKPDAMAVVVIGDANALRTDIEKLGIGEVELHEG